MITFFFPAGMDEAHFKVMLLLDLWRVIALAMSSGVSVAL
jgi:hypothetical protein